MFFKKSSEVSTFISYKHIHTHLYMCVCVCVCTRLFVFFAFIALGLLLTALVINCRKFSFTGVSLTSCSHLTIIVRCSYLWNFYKKEIEIKAKRKTNAKAKAKTYINIGANACPSIRLAMTGNYVSK